MHLVRRVCCCRPGRQQRKETNTNDEATPQEPLYGFHESSDLFDDDNYRFLAFLFARAFTVLGQERMALRSLAKIT